jgi:uncharacterized protein (TIGR02594 family)
MLLENMYNMTVEPKWLTIARGERGIKEKEGDPSNPEVEKYHKIGSNQPTWKDSVPWCASFVGWCLEQAGLPSTDSGMARSYLKYGTPLEKPKLGCIVVYQRGAPPSGHVHFFLEDLGDKIKGIGGNQSNAVTEASYKKSDVLGYRWPPTVQPDDPGPIPPPQPQIEPEKHWLSRFIEWFISLWKR